jgi:hypothetical protein
MKPGDLVLIRDGHRMYFQNPEDVPKGGIAGIFLEVKTADWCSDFFVYRFLTQRGVMELIMEEKNAAKCLSML